MRQNYLFTSESVSEGHPDKVSDQISDAIVDLFLSKDPEARVACETLTTTQLVVLAGEIRCKGVYENGQWAPGALEEIETTVRNTVRDIGYEQDGFHWQSLTFENHLHGQSAHIAQGVVRQHLPMHRAGRIDGVVPRALPPTPFARLGHLLSFFWAIAFLAFAAVAMRRRPR